MKERLEKLYVVVRGDLNPGQQLSQSVHASIGFIKHVNHENWFKNSNTVACLSTPNEVSLLELEKLLIADRIKYFKFQEPDLNDESTSIAFTSVSPSYMKRLPSTFQNSGSVKSS